MSETPEDDPRSADPGEERTDVEGDREPHGPV